MILTVKKIMNKYEILLTDGTAIEKKTEMNLYDFYVRVFSNKYYFLNSQCIINTQNICLIRKI